MFTTRIEQRLAPVRKFKSQISPGTNPHQRKSCSTKFWHRVVGANVDQENRSKDHRPSEHLKPVKTDSSVFSQPVVHEAHKGVVLLEPFQLSDKTISATLCRLLIRRC